MKNALLADNHAGSGGGGLKLRNGSSPILTNVTISGNTADGVGSGIVDTDPTYSGNIIFINCIRKTTN